MSLVEKLFSKAMGTAAKTAELGIRGVWGAGKAIASPAMRTAFAVGEPALKAGISTGATLAGVALRHPESTLLAATAGLGIAGAMSLGAETSDLSNEEAAYLARATGPSTGFTPGMSSMAYDPSRMAFVDSTHGLTLGLHRGRHGG